MQLHARCERQTPPHRALERRFDINLFAVPRLLVERPPNLVQGAPALLKRLHREELIDVFGPVVIPAPYAVGGGKQAFLNVVAHRPARHAAKIRQIADGIARVVRHGPNYATVTVALSTGTFYSGNRDVAGRPARSTNSALQPELFRDPAKPDRPSHPPRRHQLANRLEDRGEPAVILPLQRVEPPRQFGIGRERAAESYKGAHDLDVHANGAQTPKNARQHRHTLLGEHHRKVLAMPPAASV